MRKIGILGGTFDPIHVGHLSIAQQVREALGLDEVVLVPAGAPPHKRADALAPAADRLAITRLAASGLARLAVSDVEAARAETSYTIDTLARLRETMGAQNEYVLVIGADTVGELPTWHRAAELVASVRFAVAERPGAEPDFDAVKRALGDAAAKKLRAAVVRVEPADISSTDVRRRVAAGLPVDRLVRASVAEYIARKGLYGPPKTG